MSILPSPSQRWKSRRGSAAILAALAFLAGGGGPASAQTLDPVLSRGDSIYREAIRLFTAPAAAGEAAARVELAARIDAGAFERAMETEAGDRATARLIAANLQRLHAILMDTAGPTFTRDERIGWNLFRSRGQPPAASNQSTRTAKEMLTLVQSLYPSWRRARDQAVVQELYNGYRDLIESLAGAQRERLLLQRLAALQDSINALAARRVQTSPAGRSGTPGGGGPGTTKSSGDSGGAAGQWGYISVGMLGRDNVTLGLALRFHPSVLVGIDGTASLGADNTAGASAYAGWRWGGTTVAPGAYMQRGTATTGGVLLWVVQEVGAKVAIGAGAATRVGAGIKLMFVP